MNQRSVFATKHKVTTLYIDDLYKKADKIHEICAKRDKRSPVHLPPEQKINDIKAKMAGMLEKVKEAL